MDRAISRFTDQSDLMLIEETSDELMVWAQAFVEGNFSSDANTTRTSDSVFDCDENQTNPLFCENHFDIWEQNVPVADHSDTQLKLKVPTVEPPAEICRQIAIDPRRKGQKKRKRLNDVVPSSMQMVFSTGPAPKRSKKGQNNILGPQKTPHGESCLGCWMLKVKCRDNNGRCVRHHGGRKASIGHLWDRFCVHLSILNGLDKQMIADTLLLEGEQIPKRYRYNEACGVLWVTRDTDYIPSTDSRIKIKFAVGYPSRPHRRMWMDFVYEYPSKMVSRIFQAEEYIKLFRAGKLQRHKLIDLASLLVNIAEMLCVPWTIRAIITYGLSRIDHGTHFNEMSIRGVRSTCCRSKSLLNTILRSVQAYLYLILSRLDEGSNEFKFYEEFEVVFQVFEDSHYSVFSEYYGVADLKSFESWRDFALIMQNIQKKILLGPNGTP